MTVTLVQITAKLALQMLSYNHDRMPKFSSDINDYIVGSILGKGAFGSVHSATYESKPVAIKMISKRLIKDAKMNKRVSNEVEVHWQLHHPCVLELYAYFEDASNVYLVTELCDNGELFQFLQNQPNRRLTEGQVRAVLRDVIAGLDYLHSHTILHRDLKLSNLLLTKDHRVV